MKCIGIQSFKILRVFHTPYTCTFLHIHKYMNCKCYPDILKSPHTLIFVILLFIPKT